MRDRYGDTVCACDSWVIRPGFEWFRWDGVIHTPWACRPEVAPAPDELRRQALAIMGPHED